jgi:EAL domain-containing protein (putative c-di-GMP-specific phosphodiesterase class I)
MQTEAREKQALTRDLRHALSRHELEVYYQPIVDMSSGQIHKAEALLRWKHPARGMVSPVTFIPLAEESGLILEIGNWVFDQVITQIQHWNQLYGYFMEVSVNMSPRQFEHDSSNIWMERLNSERLPKKCIVVEITEGLLIKDSSKVKQRLEEFHLNGIDVSIDDFGTGFSALSYLKLFDIDYLKIDRSFVMNLTEDESDKALVKAIITMAHSLEIKTIAEGVETEAQRDILISFGCDYVQGYLYSRPVPVIEFGKLLEA